tara:strand:- start:4215 stop:5453 length:1239 start_codon:yes stop_codon:yes gene_type:complete
MKKLLFTLAIFISFASFGQTWKYSEGGDAFDGKYKTSVVTGVGTKFPYKSPSIVINKFEGKSINFYISDGGFFQDGTGISVLWVFDNEPDILYSVYDYSISSDGKILFFSEFNNPDGAGKLKPIDIIEKLTLANKVTVRMSDDYGSNDIVFSLSGSTRAINFVIPKEERQQMIDKGLAERNVLGEAEGKNQIVLDDLMKKANEEKLSSSSLSTLKSSIEKDLGLSYYTGMGTGKKYKSISVEADIGDSMFEAYGYVDVFYVLDDGSKEEIYGSWTVEMDAPIFVRLKEEKAKEELELANKLEIDKKYLDSLLSKYQRDDIISSLKDRIIKESEKYSKEFLIQNIEKIEMTISDFATYSKKFNRYLISVYLKEVPQNRENKVDGNRILIDHSYRLELTKKDLKTLGGKMGVAF